MPGPGYKRKKLPGPSKVGRSSKDSIADALGAVVGSSKDLGKGFKHAAKSRERHATRAVTKYAAGDKSFKPTLEQFRSAWPDLPKSVQDKLGPEILARARSEISPEFGPKGDKARPRPLPKFLRKYDPKGFDAYNRAIPGATAVRESQAETDKAFNNDLGRAVEAGLLVAPMGGVLRAGKLGIDAIRAARVGKAAKATEEAATAGRAAKVAETAGEDTVKQATRVGRVADAAKATRAGRAAKATTEAAKESKVLRGTRAALDTKAGRGAIKTAKIGSAPIRKPITRGYPAYLAGSGVVAAASGENVPHAITSAASMNPTGTAKEIVDRVGDELDNFGVVGNAVKDTLELPAAVVPSTALLGAATVKAIGGDSSDLKAMWDSYVKSGALSGLAKGDFDQFVTALKEHPVFSGLELYGAGAGLSRATGAGLRAAPFERLRRAGSTERKPLKLADRQHEVRREYGKGVVKKSAQVALDRRRAKRMGGQKASARETRRALAGGWMKSGLADRTVGKGNLVVRAGRAQQMEEIENLLPRKSRIPRKREAADANRAGVNLAVNYGLTARRFTEDLQRLRTKALDEQAKLVAKIRDKKLPKDERAQAKMELRTNKEFIETIENVIKRGDKETIFASASEVAPRLRQLQKDLVDSDVNLSRAQAEKAALIPAARLHLDAGYGKPVEQVAARKAWRQAKRRGEDVGPRPSVTAQVLDAEGQALSTERIKAGLRELGIEPDEQIGFVSMRPGAGGRGDFYQPWWPREQNVASRARTGEAAIRGWAAGADSLIGQMVRSRGIIDNARTFRGAIMEFAWKGPRGKIKPVKAGRIQAVKEELQARTGIGWQAVRLNPRSESKLLEEATDLTPDDMSGLMHSAELWQAARQITNEPGAEYALIPDPVWTRFNQHFSHAGVFRQSMQMVNQAFKGTVLPYSPKWLLSNVADINIRSMIAGQPPIQRVFSLNRRFALDIVGRGKAIDPVAGADVEALFEAGTHYGTQSTTRYFGRLENLAETSRLGQGLLKFRERPTIDRAVRLHQVTRDWVFNVNRNLVENPGQLAILGKQLRQEAISKGYMRRWESVWKLDDAARNDLARGLLQTENQVRYAQGIERVFGQWGHNSPAMREFLVDYAPFGMWTRAATKFVFHTLPADHPVLTGIIAATELMTQDEREKLGLSIFADRPLPDNLRGALPLPGGGLIGGVAGMSSFGFFADPGAAAAQTIIPQASSALRALEGLDWTGKRLENADGTPADEQTRMLAALKEGAETFFPPMAVIQRAKTLSGGDNAADSVRDLLLGGDISDPGVISWLRDQAGSRLIDVPVEGAEHGTADWSGPESDNSSSGSTLPPWWSGSSSSTSSSSSGTSLPPWWGQ